MTKEEFENLNKKQFDLWSRFYDSSIFRLIYFEKLYKKVIEVIKNQANGYLKPKSKFLDVGCGTAEVIFKLAKEFKEVEFFGVDFSKGMVEKAINKTFNLNNTKIIEANVENLPFEEGSFNFVICVDTFHHFYNPDSALKEIGRVLKDNGLFLLVDPSPDVFYLKLLLKIIKNLESARKYYSKKELEDLLNQHNFSIISSFTYYLNNFLLSLKTHPYHTSRRSTLSRC